MWFEIGYITTAKRYVKSNYGSKVLTLRGSEMLLFHQRILAALPWAWVALLEMHWFKWTYLHKNALLYPQRCCQGNGAANAASQAGTSVVLAAAALLGGRHCGQSCCFHERFYHALL
jgi:hypothetical protein